MIRNIQRLILVLCVAAMSARGVCGAQPPSAATTAAGPTELGDSDLTAYLAAYPKMSAFMNAKGEAMERLQTAGPGATADLESEFEGAVGMSFARFFELHGAVATAFAEALAERTRLQNLASVDEGIAELKKQLENKDLPSDIKKDLQERLADRRKERQEIEKPAPPDPTISDATRKVVQPRTEEIERVFTEADLPRQMSPEEKATAAEQATTASSSTTRGQ